MSGEIHIVGDEPGPVSDAELAMFQSGGLPVSVVRPAPARRMNITIPLPQPPEGWRRVSPMQAIGTGSMVLYGQELADLARHLPGFREGCTVNATYTQVSGEWHPIPDTVRIVGY